MSDGMTIVVAARVDLLKLISRHWHLIERHCGKVQPCHAWFLWILSRRRKHNFLKCQRLYFYSLQNLTYILCVVFTALLCSPALSCLVLTRNIFWTASLLRLDSHQYTTFIVTLISSLEAHVCFTNRVFFIFNIYRKHSKISSTNLHRLHCYDYVPKTPTCRNILFLYLL